MSLSGEERLRNLALALRLMLQELADNAIDIAMFELKAETFAETFKDVRTTTWKEFEDRYWIRRMDAIGHPMCRFTGSGWLAAIDLVWDDVKTLFEARLATLAAALKGEVKGRDEDAYVYLDSLAATSGLPESWIFNTIEAGLLEHRFNRKGAHWYDRRSGSPLIHIPVDFGLDPL
ncbi:MAG: hypothetical protein ABSG13_20300 [Bryobacteraceae bacterium]|jgi:hypothetical protein